MYFYKKLTCGDFLTGSPALSKRQKIVNEIYSSEQSYISQLSVIIDVSLQEHPCMDVNRGVPRAFISKLPTMYMSACVCTYVYTANICTCMGTDVHTYLPT